MKYFVVLILGALLLSFRVAAQCPYVSAALINSADVGLPAGEGKSEFLVFTTGSSPLSVSGFSVGYGTTTAATGFTINGATVTWQSLPASPAITNSVGTITNITTGSIPANTPVVILNADNTIDYDFATFGSNVYVLVYNSSDPGVSGYMASGNFANKSAPSALRYFRVTAGTCNSVVAYDRNASAFSAADGAGAKWDAAGNITYANTGSSGAILPIELLDFSLRVQERKVQLYWSTASKSSASFFEVQRSSDARNFVSLTRINAQQKSDDFSLNYTFEDVPPSAGNWYYRLVVQDRDGEQFFAAMRMAMLGSDVQQEIRLFPNPAQQELQVVVPFAVLGYRIIDASSGKYTSTNWEPFRTQINLSTLPAGFYFLQLYTQNHTYSLKFVKE